MWSTISLLGWSEADWASCVCTVTVCMCLTFPLLGWIEADRVCVFCAFAESTFCHCPCWIDLRLTEPCICRLYVLDLPCWVNQRLTELHVFARLQSVCACHFPCWVDLRLTEPCICRLYVLDFPAGLSWLSLRCVRVRRMYVLDNFLLDWSEADSLRCLHVHRLCVLEISCWVHLRLTVSYVCVFAEKYVLPFSLLDSSEADRALGVCTFTASTCCHFPCWVYLRLMESACCRLYVLDIPSIWLISCYSLDCFHTSVSWSTKLLDTCTCSYWLLSVITYITYEWRKCRLGWIWHLGD